MNMAYFNVIITRTQTIKEKAAVFTGNKGLPEFLNLNSCPFQ